MIKTVLAQKPVVVLAALNLLDLVLTLIGVIRGYITEGNPVMQYFLNRSSESFVIVKIVLSVLAFFVIGYGYYRFQWVRYAIIVPLAAYAYAMLLHVSWIYLLLAGKISG